MSELRDLKHAVAFNMSVCGVLGLIHLIASLATADPESMGLTAVWLLLTSTQISIYRTVDQIAAKCNGGKKGHE